MSHSGKSDRVLRKRKTINYRDDDRTDDWRSLGIFQIKRSVIIKQNSNYGELIADSISYPYFQADQCWMRLFCSGYFWEKKLEEISKLSPLFYHKYIMWVIKLYPKLEEHYKFKIHDAISNAAPRQYNLGDIVVCNVYQGTNGPIFAKISSITLQLRTGKMRYTLSFIDIERALQPLNEYDICVNEQDITNRVVSALYRFQCNENTKDITLKIMQYERDTYAAKFKVITNICYDCAENIITILCEDWLKVLNSNSINQHRKVKAPMRPIMFEEMMKPYLESSYFIAKVSWKNGKTNLTLDQVQTLFCKDAVIVQHRGSEIFIAEPELIYKKNENRLYFQAHVCKFNPITYMIIGDPVKKRLRKKLKRKKRRRDKLKRIKQKKTKYPMDWLDFQSKLPQFASVLIAMFLMK